MALLNVHVNYIEKQKTSETWENITKTRLFKYIENFTTQTGKISDKKSDFFQISSQNGYPHSMIFSKIRKIMYTPVNPNFTI